jgi:hypothetical protein
VGVFTTVATVMAGAAWLLAISMQARADTRSAVAYTPPSARLAWVAPVPDTTTGPPAIAASRPVIVASLSPPITETASDAPALEPIGAPIRVVPASPDARGYSSVKQDRTGSLGTPATQRPAADVVSVKRAKPVATLEEMQPPPLPRARPRLASLTPSNDLVIKPEEDIRPLRTAFYDIAAQTVYLPSGERLEAHSGLGHMMDDPRYVSEKNRGATPPNTYELKLRESLFHGVQAIRLTPVGDGKMFNRDGILAHSYMLGPNGQSNGCVSFRDYPKFLRAFLRGEFDRMVVISRMDKPPTFAAARRSVRSANAQ